MDGASCAVRIAQEALSSSGLEYRSYRLQSIYYQSDKWSAHPMLWTKVTKSSSATALEPWKGLICWYPLSGSLPQHSFSYMTGDLCAGYEAISIVQTRRIFTSRRPLCAGYRWMLRSSWRPHASSDRQSLGGRNDPACEETLPRS